MGVCGNVPFTSFNLYSDRLHYSCVVLGLATRHHTYTSFLSLSRWFKCSLVVYGGETKAGTRGGGERRVGFAPRPMRVYV